MAIYQMNDAAVARNGDFVTILLAPSPEVVNELRGLLAEVNSEGVGAISEGLRHLLSDTEAALNEAFHVRRTRQPVCKNPDCGCD